MDDIEIGTQIRRINAQVHAFGVVERVLDTLALVSFHLDPLWRNPSWQPWPETWREWVCIEHIGPGRSTGWVIS